MDLWWESTQQFLARTKRNLGNAGISFAIRAAWPSRLRSNLQKMALLRTQGIGVSTQDAPATTTMTRGPGQKSHRFKQEALPSGPDFDAAMSSSRSMMNRPLPEFGLSIVDPCTSDWHQTQRSPQTRNQNALDTCKNCRCSHHRFDGEYRQRKRRFLAGCT